MVLGLRQGEVLERAGQLWWDSGCWFTNSLGEPVNPSTDYHAWKWLLAAAGLRDGRPHDARHTVVTVLLILGVPERAVMGLMGWSTTAMAAPKGCSVGVPRAAFQAGRLVVISSRRGFHPAGPVVRGASHLSRLVARTGGLAAFGRTVAGSPPSEPP